MNETEQKQMSEELEKLKNVMFEELEKLKKLHSKMEIQLSNHLEVAGTIDKYEDKRVSKMEESIKSIEKKQDTFITSSSVKLIVIITTGVVGTLIGVLTYILGVKR